MEPILIGKRPDLIKEGTTMREIECNLISMSKKEVCRSLADENDLKGNRERALHFRRAAAHDVPERFLSDSEYDELFFAIAEMGG